MGRMGPRRVPVCVVCGEPIVTGMPTKTTRFCKDHRPRNSQEGEQMKMQFAEVPEMVLPRMSRPRYGELKGK